MNRTGTKLGVNGPCNFYYGKGECLAESRSKGILFLFFFAEIFLSLSDAVKNKGKQLSETYL